MMPRRLHILACAKAGSCALGPFSVGYTMSISGHLRALIEFLRTTTSVNPIDWKIRRGDRKASMALQFPVILGRDVAGEISAAAAGASDFKLGQKVMALADRTYAEFVAVPIAVLAPVPEGLDIEQAGALPLVVSTGAELTERIGPQRGDTVLVTGALGGVGRTAVYVALELGARVIVGVRARQKQQAQALKAAQ